MKKIIIPIGIAVVIAAIFGAVSLTNNNSDNATNLVNGVDYAEKNSILKDALNSRSLSMSSAIKLQGNSIKEYCSFFSDEVLQQEIEYCTSTEIKGPDGKFLGNIHMVGTFSTPKIIMAIIQVDSSMFQIIHVNTIFEQVIQHVVCDCWVDEKPGGFESVRDWVDGLKDFHTSDNKPTSKSKSILLEGQNLQLELTTNSDGYLWKLIVSNQS